MKEGWIGFDLDGTLVRTGDWRDMEYVGTPIPAMAERVRGWLAEGREVRIFTARVSGLFQPDASKAERMVAQKAQWAVEDWCTYHFGEKLSVTAVKDFNMALLYDDRCVPIETDTGRLMASEIEPADLAAEGTPREGTGARVQSVDQSLWRWLAVQVRHLSARSVSVIRPNTS